MSKALVPSFFAPSPGVGKKNYIQEGYRMEKEHHQSHFRLSLPLHMAHVINHNLCFRNEPFSSSIDRLESFKTGEPFMIHELFKLKDFSENGSQKVRIKFQFHTANSTKALTQVSIPNRHRCKCESKSDQTQVSTKYCIFIDRYSNALKLLCNGFISIRSIVGA